MSFHTKKWIFTHNLNKLTIILVDRKFGFKKFTFDKIYLLRSYWVINLLLPKRKWNVSHPANAYRLANVGVNFWNEWDWMQFFCVANFIKLCHFVILSNGAIYFLNIEKSKQFIINYAKENMNKTNNVWPISIDYLAVQATTLSLPFVSQSNDQCK